MSEDEIAQEEAGRVLEVPAPVASALQRFADETRRLSMRACFGWAGCTLLSLFTLLAFADFFQLLGDGSRKTLALLAYAAVIGFTGFLLSRALRRRTPTEIALALEGRVPDGALEERVSTTVELAERYATHQLGDEGVSDELISRVADEAAVLIERINIEELPDRSRMQRSQRAILAAVIGCVALCLIPPLHMPVLYARAFLPWQKMQRPSETKITVLPGDARIVEGAPLQIEAQLSGRVTKDVHVEMREQNSSAWVATEMSADSAPARFKLTLASMRARADYRIRAGDGLTAEYHIQILPRPEITGMKITVTYPAYANKAPDVFERISGDLSVLKGSKIELGVTSNTDLSAAVLEFSNDRHVSMAVTPKAASATFDVIEDSQYRIQLRSTEGVSNPDAPLFSIIAVPDKAPQVAVNSPTSEESTDPGTLLNLETRAEDDFGIISMRLVVKTEQRAKPITIPLQKPEDAGKVWLVSQPWDLAGLFLQDGESLTYRVEAVDSSGSVGKSDERRLRIESGQKHPSGKVLAELEKVQRNVDGAHRLLSTARKDIAEMRQLFRPEDVEYQAAERLLLEESLRRIGRETQTGAALLEALAPEAESGSMRTLVQALSNALARFSASELHPLHSNATRARSNDSAAVAAGLEVLLVQTPKVEERLNNLHQALTAAHRYAGATVLDERGADVKKSQQKITPVLVGAAAWSPKGTYTPGLAAEFYKGTHFEQLVRRAIDSKLELKAQELPDVGRANFTIRWKGQILSPRKGRYVFRATVDDGVRLTVAGNKIIDEWRAQGTATFEGAVELKEGWSDIVLEFMQGIGGFEFSLVRSGPKIATGAIPPEHLRTIGTAIAPNTDDVKAAMGLATSESSVQQALVRLQTMIQAAQTLSPEYTRIAKLPPLTDDEGSKQSSTWGKDFSKYSAELVGVKTLNPALAIPISKWQEHTGSIARHYAAVRVRYKAQVDEWARKLAADVFEASAKLKDLQQNAEAAKKAFDELVQIAKQPKDEKRDAAMQQADAMVRSMAEDLQSQAREIAAEFAKEAADVTRPLEERRILQALEHKAEMMALEPAGALTKRLEEAKTAEDLAKTDQKTPNFGSQTAELGKKAGELAQAAEKMERAIALRDALKDLAREELEARVALTDAPTAENAARQQEAAAQLKEEAAELKQAVDAAKNNVDVNTLNKAQQLADQAAANKASDMLTKRAEQTLAGELSPKKDAASAPARQAVAKELADQAKKANEAADAIEKELAQQAQQLNGDVAAALREAAKDLQSSANALEAAKQPAQAAEALGKAADKAIEAQAQAAHAAEQLALNAEAARNAAKTDAEKARADDLVRLAAAINNEVEKQIAPLAQNLDRAQKNPEAVAVPAEAQAQQKAEAEKLKKLADIAAKLHSADAAQQKQAHDALAAVLEEQGATKPVEAALAQANALEAAASQLDKAEANLADAAAGDKPADAAKEAANEAAAEAALDAAEKALAAALGADAKATEKAAMAERLGEMADELRAQAEQERKLANHLNQAAGLEQQVRENLKKEAPALATTLKDAQKNAASAAKGKSPEIAQPLNAAQQDLGKAAENAANAAKQADSAPLEQLAGELKKLSKEIEKPIGELANALSKGGEEMQDAQRAGREARNAAGRAAELAGELERAERAGDLASAEAADAKGDRAELEAEVQAAIAFLEKEGAIPSADLAALKKSAGAPAEAGPLQGKGEKGQAAGQQGQKSAEAAEPTPASMQLEAERARGEAERLQQIAAQMEKMAASLSTDGSAPGKNSPSPSKVTSTPAADALEAIADAEAALATGDAAEAAEAVQEAQNLLEQAAEAARAQATGMKTPGESEAQALADGEPSPKGKGKGKGLAQGKGKPSAQKPGVAQSKGALAPEPPAGIPIDKATWNRLPDNLRRDLLNAAGGRFPAEYENSIKRYFKNVASTKEEKR